MDIENHRDLKLLEAVEEDSRVTQRSLATKLGIALGLTNIYLKRLVRKGYIKCVNVQSNRITYLITPRGIAEKARLTYEFMDYSLHLFGEVRQHLRTALQACARANRRVAICGRGEAAELAYLSLKESGLEPVAIFDTVGGHDFLGIPVRPISDHDQVAIDREPRNLFCFRAREDDARRIGGRVEVNRATVRGGVARQRFRKAIAARFCCRHENDASLAMRDQIFDGRPVWREHQNFIAWIDNGLKRAEQTLHPAVNDNHIFNFGGNPVTVSNFVHNGRPQFRNARRWRIARLVLFESMHHTFFDEFRCVDERFAAFELINGCAFSTQRHYSVADIYDVGEANFIEPRGESEKSR